MIIEKKTMGEQWVEIHSEAVDDNYYTSLEIKLKTICDMDFNKNIRFSIYSKESEKIKTYQYSTEFNVAQLKNENEFKFEPVYCGASIHIENWFIRKIDS